MDSYKRPELAAADQSHAEISSRQPKQGGEMTKRKLVIDALIGITLIHCLRAAKKSGVMILNEKSSKSLKFSRKALESNHSVFSYRSISRSADLSLLKMLLSANQSA